MARIRLLAALLLAPLLVGAGEVLPEPDYASDARAIERVVEDNYAYLERFEDGRMPLSDKLRAEAEAVDSREALIRYAERALATLADHHAITASSLADSWALVPSYADLWVEPDFTIGAVRENSPAERAGIRQGDRLVAVAGEPVTEAVAAFWSDLGLAVTPERAGYAARVLAAGRRNAARRLTVAGPGGPRELTLDSLYAARPEGRDPLTVGEAADVLTIRFNDSLGDGATIAAFDAAMRRCGRPGRDNRWCSTFATPRAAATPPSQGRSWAGSSTGRPATRCIRCRPRSASSEFRASGSSRSCPARACTTTGRRS